MVNHVRTLLLNRRAASITSPIWIPPEFRPVVLPGFIARLRQTVIPAGEPEDEMRATDALMRILHHPELEAYTLRFDPRITYRTAEHGLADIAVADPPTVHGAAEYARLIQVMADMAESVSVFKWEAYQTDLDNLRRAWSESSEGLLRSGAVLLGLAYQVERIRRTG